MSFHQVGHILGGGVAPWLVAASIGVAAMVSPAPEGAARVPVAPGLPVAMAAQTDEFLPAGEGDLPPVVRDEDGGVVVSKDGVIGWVGIAGMVFMAGMGMYRQWRQIRREEGGRDEDANKESLRAEIEQRQKMLDATLKRLEESEEESDRLSSHVSQLNDSLQTVQQLLEHIKAENRNLRAACETPGCPYAGDCKRNPNNAGHHGDGSEG